MEKRSVSWASPDGLSLLAQGPFYGFWSRLRWMVILASLRPIARLPFSRSPNGSSCERNGGFEGSTSEGPSGCHRGDQPRATRPRRGYLMCLSGTVPLARAGDITGRNWPSPRNPRFTGAATATFDQNLGEFARRLPPA